MAPDGVLALVLRGDARKATFWPDPSGDESPGHIQDYLRAVEVDGTGVARRLIGKGFSIERFDEILDALVGLLPGIVLRPRLREFTPEPDTERSATTRPGTSEPPRPPPRLPALPARGPRAGAFPKRRPPVPPLPALSPKGSLGFDPANPSRTYRRPWAEPAAAPTPPRPRQVLHVATARGAKRDSLASSFLASPKRSYRRPWAEPVPSRPNTSAGVGARSAGRGAAATSEKPRPMTTHGGAGSRAVVPKAAGLGALTSVLRTESDIASARSFAAKKRGAPKSSRTAKPKPPPAAAGTQRPRPKSTSTKKGGPAQPPALPRPKTEPVPQASTPPRQRQRSPTPPPRAGSPLIRPPLVVGTSQGAPDTPVAEGVAANIEDVTEPGGPREHVCEAEIHGGRPAKALAEDGAAEEGKGGGAGTQEAPEAEPAPAHPLALADGAGLANAAPLELEMQEVWAGTNDEETGLPTEREGPSADNGDIAVVDVVVDAVDEEGTIVLPPAALSDQPRPEPVPIEPAIVGLPAALENTPAPRSPPAPAAPPLPAPPFRPASSPPATLKPKPPKTEKRVTVRLDGEQPKRQMHERPRQKVPTKEKPPAQPPAPKRVILITAQGLK